MKLYLDQNEVLIEVGYPTTYFGSASVVDMKFQFQCPVHRF